MSNESSTDLEQQYYIMKEKIRKSEEEIREDETKRDYVN